MDFSLLKKVQKSLSITDVAKYEDYATLGIDISKNDTYGPLDIRFPSLENATTVNLSGNISQ
jgi:hypothetical protein